MSRIPVFQHIIEMLMTCWHLGFGNQIDHLLALLVAHGFNVEDFTVTAHQALEFVRGINSGDKVSH